MFALIENGLVAEITNIDPTGRYHPSMLWVGCPDYVVVGWQYDGTSFTPPELSSVDNDEE